MASLHEPKMIQRVHAPGFRGFVGLSTSRRKHKIIGAKINRVAVEITRLDQNGKEVDSLQIFQRTSLGFCKKWNCMLSLASHNFGEGFKEIFK